MEERKEVETDNLEVSVRTANILLYNKIETYQQLCSMTERDIIRLKGAGRKTLLDLKEAMAEKNLALKREHTSCQRRKPLSFSILEKAIKKERSNNSMLSARIKALKSGIDSLIIDRDSLITRANKAEKELALVKEELKKSLQKKHEDFIMSPDHTPTVYDGMTHNIKLLTELKSIMETHLNEHKLGG